MSAIRFLQRFPGFRANSRVIIGAKLPAHRFHLLHPANKLPKTADCPQPKMDFGHFGNLFARVMQM
jgi:hypothetical protein